MKAADFSYHEAVNLQDAIKIKSQDDEAVSYTHLTLPTTEAV